MIYDEAAYLISSRFSGAPNLDTMIQVEMRLAQTMAELDPIKPWFLVKRAPNFQVTTAGYADMPADFLQEYSEDDSMAVYLKFDVNSTKLTPLTKRNLSQIYDNDYDYPMSYALIGDRMEFRPVPLVTYPGLLIYYAKDKVVQMGEENQWLKHAPGMLIGAAGEGVGQFLGADKLILDYFTKMKMDARTLLMNQTIARREANRVVLYGSEQ